MSSEPTVDRVVRAIQLARARAKYQGFMKGVTASLLDIEWLLEQTTQAGKNEVGLDMEGGLLVKRYLEMEVPYRTQQMKEFLGALEEAGLSVGELPQTLEKLESERESLLARVQAEPGGGDDRGAAKVELRELAGFARRLDSVGKELDRQAHEFLVAFIQNSRVSKEMATTLLGGEEAAGL